MTRSQQRIDGDPFQDQARGSRRLSPDRGKTMIVNGFSSPLLVDVVGRFGEQRGLRPAYWLARPNVGDMLRSRFPELLFLSSDDARPGVSERPWPFEPAVVDQAVVERFAKYESSVMLMMERYKAYSSLASYQDKLRVYYEHLAHVLGVLGHLQPACFLSRETPHSVLSYLLYVVCREERIPTLILEYSVIFNRFQVTGGIEGDRSHLSRSNGRPRVEGSAAELSGKLAAYQATLRQDYETYRANNAALQASFHFDSTKPTLENLLTLGQKENPIRQRFQYKNEGLRFLRTVVPNLRFMWFIRKLKKYYESIAQRAPDLGVPFVYIPLHYQPESSTLPNGGVYANQWLMVQVVANAVPKGWKVYVKEHPLTFQSLTRGIQGFRSQSLYDALVALPNVEIVSLSTSPFELIDRAKAVATINGTAGWEAVNRGRPVLTFGHAPYRECEGVLFVPDYPRCRAALEAIESGYEFDPAGVDGYLAVLARHSLPGLLEDILEADRVAASGALVDDESSPEEKVDRITGALVRYLDDIEASHDPS